MRHTSVDERPRSSRPFVGSSAWVRQIQAKICAVAPYLSNVLISGPSGTGKELIARAIHRESPQSEMPFIAVNCAAVSGPLFESHMFGHVQGAFTGADHSALGCFRAADGGTIFLDEIGEMELSLQAKLLRVLQERTVTPVGSYEEHPVSLRVIVATNRNLAEAVAAGEFREDLYYRLAVVLLKTLPLAERREDIALLADYFLSTQCVQYGLPFKPLSAEALQLLEEYHWPGNVREMQNVLERATLLSPGEIIMSDDISFEDLGLSTALSTSTTAASNKHTQGETPVKLAACDDSTGNPIDNQHWLSLKELERRHIRDTLDHTRHNQTAAARLLGLDRSVLRRRIQKLDVVQS